MFDSDDASTTYFDAQTTTAASLQTSFRNRVVFRASKRAFDIIVSLFLMLVMASTAVALLVLNPFLNPGPLFYRQDRMGQGCKPFQAVKFRTMLPTDGIERGPFDKLEVNRITKLGSVLRKTRLDELPQAMNVLRGEMSLIGPRPDYFGHAQVYLGAVPGYRERHLVKPGISGYAQIEVGYADGIETVQAKVNADLHYIRNTSFLFDMWIAWRTVVVVVTRKGT